jgi:hypothetical protein
MRTLRRWRGLTAPRRSLLPHALLVVIGVRLGLFLLPFGVLQRLLGLARRRVANAYDTCTEMDIAWCVERASRFVPGATCLTQALATDLLLVRGGIAASLLIGVRRSDRAALEAHAWVEIDGRIVACGREADSYVPLQSNKMKSRRRQLAGQDVELMARSQIELGENPL